MGEYRPGSGEEPADFDPDVELDFDDFGFDEQLRELLDGQRDDRGFEQPQQVLAELRPRIVRANRVRRVQVAATVAAPIVLIIGGLIALPRLSSSVERQSTVAGEPEETSMSLDEESPTGTTVRVSGITTAGPSVTADGDDAERVIGLGDPATAEVDPDSDDPDSVTTGAPTTFDRPTTVGADATNTTQTPAPQPSTSTTAATTTPSITAPGGGSTSVPGSRSVQSDCGSIVVVVVDGAAELIDTLPDPGYRADVKSSGPEVEVSLEGRRSHCELKAEFERGRLVTSVDNEDDGDDS